MDDRGRTTIDLRITAMPGWGTSGFHRAGRHCLHQVRSGGKTSAIFEYMPWTKKLATRSTTPLGMVYHTCSDTIGCI